jgi:hypothetical protein
MPNRLLMSGAVLVPAARGSVVDEPALVANGIDAYVPKGYLYVAMVFSVFIELINMWQRRKARPVHLRNPYGEESPEESDERRALEQAGFSSPHHHTKPS